MWETTKTHCGKGPLPHGPSQHHSVFATRLVTNLSLCQFRFHHNLLNVFSCNSSCLSTLYLHFYAVETCVHPLLLPCFLFYRHLSLQCFISCTILKRFCYKHKSWAMLESCCYYFYFTIPSVKILLVMQCLYVLYTLCRKCLESPGIASGSV